MGRKVALVVALAAITFGAVWLGRVCIPTKDEVLEFHEFDSPGSSIVIKQWKFLDRVEVDIDGHGQSCFRCRAGSHIDCVRSITIKRSSLDVEVEELIIMRCLCTDPIHKD